MDKERILIFSNQECLKELGMVQYIAADGTFKLSPTLLTQIISVHEVYPAGGGSISTVFGLLIFGSSRH